jgi:hypothetical protein
MRQKAIASATLDPRGRLYLGNFRCPRLQTSRPESPDESMLRIPFTPTPLLPTPPLLPSLWVVIPETQDVSTESPDEPRLCRLSPQVLNMMLSFLRSKARPREPRAQKAEARRWQHAYIDLCWRGPPGRKCPLAKLRGAAYKHANNM